MTYSNWLGSTLRIAVLATVYALVIVASLAASMMLRFDLNVPAEFWGRFWSNLPWIIAIKLALLTAFGQFRSLLSYFSLPDAKMIALALACAAFIQLGVWLVFAGVGVVPRGVIVSDMILSFVGLTGLRTALRLYREHILHGSAAHGSLKRKVAILGTGPTAALLLRDIQSRAGLGLDVVCLISDDPSKAGGTIHGTPVLGPLSHFPKIAKSLGIQKVMLAMPDAKPQEVRRIVNELNGLGLEHTILPSVAQLLRGQAAASSLRHVEPADLLGRDEVRLDEEGISGMLRGKVIMITGAGGSIGSELCRQVAALNPERILLVERSEPALFAIEQELLRMFPHVELVSRVHDVCDEERMENFFAAQRPAFVFQAAAHKHVPLMEEQPEEAFRNNVLGTAVVARLAIQHKAEKFVLISSDKAANPCNAMGCSKRLAEMVIEQSQKSGGHSCAFSAVRFGNVLGSSGSVVTIFHRQIAEGGPVTVTHPEATRFFMSLPEAVGLILQSALQSRGGEIFVLDMGTALKIDDLARQMIELSGFVPDEDIKIAYTGLRRGERLHEEAVHLSEAVLATGHPKVRQLSRARPDAPGETMPVEFFSRYAQVARDVQRLGQWLPASSRTKP